MITIFPWDNNEKPYWVNPENGYEWYVDKNLTEYCTKQTPMRKVSPLDAICFYVVEVEEGGKRNPLGRCLIDRKSNKVLAEETSLEAMAVKIDAFRIAIEEDGSN